MAGPVQPLLDADIRSLGLEESYRIDPAVDNMATLLESLAADLRAGRIWVRGSFGATIKREFKQTKPKPGKEEELTVDVDAHLYFLTSPDYVLRARMAPADVTPTSPQPVVHPVGEAPYIDVGGARL